MSEQVGWQHVATGNLCQPDGDPEELRAAGYRPVYAEPQERPVVHVAATAVLVAGWEAVRQGTVNSRSALGDALLSLRDALNPDWPANPDWLPEGGS